MRVVFTLMGKRNRPGGRRRGRMADASKTLGSPESDDHLGDDKKLRDDSEKQQQGHTNEVRKKKGLPPRDPLVPHPAGGGKPEDSRPMEEDDIPLLPGELILLRRIYSHTPSGMALGREASRDEFVAANRRVRRERAVYREVTGQMVTYGKVYAKGGTKRKEGRKGACPLRTLMVRLMPQEGEIAGERMSSKSLARAVDRSISEFERHTGAEVINAVVHRMSGHDLHIHVQYTMVKKELETPQMLGKRLKPWKAKASALSRAALAAEGITDPPPALVGGRTNKLIRDGVLEPRPVAAVEYKKMTALRSIADDAMLGYSFKNKLNLVRAAEQGEDPSLVERVIRKNDEPGKFRGLLKIPDKQLEAFYLDLWFERVWRESVRGQLKRDAREAVRLAGLDVANDYATYGTTVVEQTHLDRQKAEQAAEALKLEQDRAELTSTIRNSVAIQLRSAQQLLSGEVLPAPGTVIEARQALMDSVETVREKTRQEAWEGVWRKLTNRWQDPLPGSSAEKMERVVETVVEETKTGAVLSGLKEAFWALFPNREQHSEDAKEIQREIASGIRERVADCYRAVLGVLFPGRKLVSSDPEKMQEELVTAAEEFKGAALKLGLATVQRELLGDEVPVPEEVSDLEESVRSAVADFRAGARREAAEVILGDKMERAEATGIDPFSAVGEEFERLRDSEALLKEFAAAEVEVDTQLGPLHEQARQLLQAHAKSRVLAGKPPVQEVVKKTKPKEPEV